MDSKFLLRTACYCEEPRVFLESHLLYEQKIDFLNKDAFMKSYWFKALTAFADEMYEIMTEAALYPTVNINKIFSRDIDFSDLDGDPDEEDENGKKKANRARTRFYTKEVEDWENRWEDEIEDYRYAISLLKEIELVNYPKEVASELKKLISSQESSLNTALRTLNKVKSDISAERWGNLKLGSGDSFRFGFYRGKALTLLSDAMEILTIPWDYVWPYFRTSSKEKSREQEYYEKLGLVRKDKDGKTVYVDTIHGEDLESSAARDKAASGSYTESKKSKAFRRAFFEALELDDVECKDKLNKLKKKEPAIFKAYIKFFNI